MSTTNTQQPAPGKRIHVVGTTGSGKTTMARRLAQLLGCPHVELDALHWGPNWTPVDLELFRERTSEALSHRCWAADGNYSKVRDLVFARADTIVWLDYPLPLILWRLVWRTGRRLVLQEELWNTNRERLRNHLGRDSLLLWALRTYWRRKREYGAMMRDPMYAGLVFVHLTSPQAAEAWLSAVVGSSD